MCIVHINDNVQFICLFLFLTLISNFMHRRCFITRYFIFWSDCSDRSEGNKFRIPCGTYQSIRYPTKSVQFFLLLHSLLGSKLINGHFIFTLRSSANCLMIGYHSNQGKIHSHFIVSLPTLQFFFYCLMPFFINYYYYEMLNILVLIY